MLYSPSSFLLIRGSSAREKDRIRGRPSRQPNFFVAINLQSPVPADHPVRPS